MVNYGTIATGYSGAVGLEIDVLPVACIQRYIKILSPRQRTDVGIGVFRPGLLRPVPLADGSLLEAVTYASEERSVLVAGVSDGVLESVDQTDIGTETEVNLAVFESSRSVQTHVEALVSTSLEGIELTRGRETVGERRTSFYRYSEVVAETYADTEVHGYADVVEAVAIAVAILVAFLTESHPRSEVDARSEFDFGSNAGAEARADLRVSGDATYLADTTSEVSTYFDTRVDGRLSLSREHACNESEGGKK